MSKILAMCAYCGGYFIVDNINQIELEETCFWCNQGKQLINTQHVADFFATKYMTKDQYKLSELLMEQYVRHNSLYKQEYEDKRIDNEVKLLQMGANWRKLDFVDDTLNPMQSQSTNTPHCPTCGSTDIEKISAASKVGKGILFGLFSAGSISKTFHCKNCGMKF
jgi:predicted RNA-binding Zn-ribbon protein involved in translation (DUF1610 family)